MNGLFALAAIGAFALDGVFTEFSNPLGLRSTVKVFFLAKMTESVIFLAPLALLAIGARAHASISSSMRSTGAERAPLLLEAIEPQQRVALEITIQ